jgi:hypothetical protein
MLMRSSFVAACVALLSAPVALGQDGVLAPPRGAWNGVEGAELLQWSCADGNAQVRHRELWAPPSQPLGSAPSAPPAEAPHVYPPSIQNSFARLTASFSRRR